LYNFTDSNNIELLQQAAILADEGQLRAARSLVKQALRNNNHDAEAWWALTQLAANDNERNHALKEVLLREPHNPHALHLCDQIRAGSVPSLNIHTYPKPEYRKNPKHRMDDSYMRRKNYMLAASATLICYYIFWIVGIALNLYFLYEAHRMEQVTGVKQQNVGCLQALLGVWVGLPIAGIGLLLLMILVSGSW
jgi:hypothetical protein